MDINNWTELKTKLFGESTRVNLVSSKNITVCKFNILEKTNIKLHAHVNEQITIILKGKLRINMDGEIRDLSSGDVVVIPSNKEHSVEITDVPFESLDVFSPVRKDFLEQLEKK